MTLEDVAKRARVSTATVSRVLNGAREVRPATRARVMRAVEELNYTPDLNARSLAGGLIGSGTGNSALGTLAYRALRPAYSSAETGAASGFSSSAGRSSISASSVAV